jgi:hypothetical protein
VDGPHHGAQRVEFGHHLRARSVAAEIHQVVGMPAVVVQREHRALLGQGQETAG